MTTKYYPDHNAPTEYPCGCVVSPVDDEGGIYLVRECQEFQNIYKTIEKMSEGEPHDRNVRQAITFHLLEQEGVSDDDV